MVVPERIIGPRFRTERVARRERAPDIAVVPMDVAKPGSASGIL